MITLLTFLPRSAFTPIISPEPRHGSQEGISRVFQVEKKRKTAGSPQVSSSEEPSQRHPGAGGQVGFLLLVLVALHDDHRPPTWVNGRDPTEQMGFQCRGFQHLAMGRPSGVCRIIPHCASSQGGRGRGRVLAQCHDVPTHEVPAPCRGWGSGQ